MRFISLIRNTVARSRRYVSKQTGVLLQPQEGQELSPGELAKTIRLLQNRVSELEARVPPAGMEFEVNCEDEGTLIYLNHNIGGPIRWYVTQWMESSVSLHHAPTECAMLVRDSSKTTTDTLVLKSFVPGRACIRIEPSQDSMYADYVADPGTWRPNQRWSVVRSELTPTASAGNYTLGVKFHITEKADCYGVKIRIPSGGNGQTFKVCLWDSGGTLVASASQVCYTGNNRILFSQHYALTPFSTYTVSFWETSSTNYYQLTLAASSLPSNPYYAGGIVYIEHPAKYSAGDAYPTTNAAATYAYPVEPYLI